MSLDYPVRKDWLKRRATRQRGWAFMGWRHVSVWWEERVIKTRDEQGKPVEITTMGPWVATYVRGRNLLKHKLGRGALRKRIRREVQREAVGFYTRKADAHFAQLIDGAA